MDTIKKLSLSGIAAATVTAIAICTATPPTVTITVAARSVPQQIVNKASAFVVAPQTGSNTGNNSVAITAATR